MEILRMMLEKLYIILDVAEKAMSIAACGIAVYLFVFKRGEIKSIIKVLTNYASQQTLGELRGKIDRLNNLNFNEPTHRDEIVNILNEIVGQIKGNKKLCTHCQEVIDKIMHLAENPKKCSEPIKRSAISQLRELLRHYDIINYVDEGRVGHE